MRDAVTVTMSVPEAKALLKILRKAEANDALSLVHSVWVNIHNSVNTLERIKEENESVLEWIRPGMKVRDSHNLEPLYVLAVNKLEHTAMVETVHERGRYQRPYNCFTAELRSFVKWT